MAKIDSKIELTKSPFAPVVDPLIVKRNQDILSMKEEGYSITQIGRYFNLTKQGVSKILIRLRKEKSEE